MRTRAAVAKNALYIFYFAWTKVQRSKLVTLGSVISLKDCRRKPV